MEVEKSVVEKAKAILAKRDQDLADFNMALRAGICPTCGESLIVDKKDHVACPNNHLIISPKGYNMDRPSYDDYDGENSPNKAIREYCIKYFQDTYD